MRSPTLLQPWTRLAAAAAVLVAMAPDAVAQAPDTDFVVEQFEPLPNQGTNILNIGKSDVIPHLKPSVGLVMHVQDDPLQLVLRDDPSQIRQRVVDHVFKGEFWASIGLFDFIDVGLVMPIVFHQQAGELISEGGGNFTAFTTGDLRLVPKFRILDPEEMKGFGLAIIAPIHLPTGDAGSYNSEGVVRIEPRLVLDFQYKGFVAAVNLGYQPRNRRDMLNFENTDVFRWGVGLEAPIIEDQLSAVATVFGSVPVGADVSISEGRTMPIEALGGVQAYFAEDFVVNAGAGAGLTSGVGAPDWRIFASVGYVPRRKIVRDLDGDGILDDVDACPEVPEDFDGFQDEDGCPELDNDNDGVPDTADGAPDSTGYGACRDLPEDFDGFQDADGCPDPDNDQDGIPDVKDGPKEATGFGACRDEPEDFDGFQDDDGCPEPDNDQDRICDPWVNERGLLEKYTETCTGIDQCPDEPETYNDFKDDDGCPDIKPKALLTETAIQILEKVYFDFNKDTIQQRSYPLLDEVVEILQQNPQVNLIRIEGHTDKIGTRAYNLGLSDRRAKSVMKYLMKRGVDKARLIAKGFGPDFPIDTNETQEGRDNNRRVEFNILEIGGKPVENQIIRTKPKPR
jgi:outer membrane protein OmpA-like peptidoglycan-associated protein